MPTLVQQRDQRHVAVLLAREPRLLVLNLRTSNGVAAGRDERVVVEAQTGKRLAHSHDAAEKVGVGVAAAREVAKPDGETFEQHLPYSLHPLPVRGKSDAQLRAVGQARHRLMQEGAGCGVALVARIVSRMMGLHVRRL